MDSPMKEKNASENCEDNDEHFYDTETFETSWLKYCDYKKVDILEISNSLSILNNMLKRNENDRSGLSTEPRTNTPRTPQPSKNLLKNTTKVVKTLNVEEFGKKISNKKPSRRYTSEHQDRNLASNFSPKQSDSSSGFRSSQKNVSPIKLVSTTQNAKKKQRVKRSFSEMNTPDFQLYHENNGHFSPRSDSSKKQPLLICLDQPEKASSPSSKRHLSDSQEICLPSALTHEDFPKSRLDELIPSIDIQSTVSDDKNSRVSSRSSSLPDEPDQASESLSKRRRSGSLEICHSSAFTCNYFSESILDELLPIVDIQPTISNQKTSSVSSRSSALEHNYCMNSTQVSSDQPDEPVKAFYPSSKRRRSVSQEICQSSALTHDDFPESVLNELLPMNDRQSTMSNENQNSISPLSLTSDSNSCMKNIQDSSDQQLLLSFPDEPYKTLAPFSKRRRSDSSALSRDESILNELLPINDIQSPISSEHCFTESIILESLLDEPLPDCNLPPPLLPIPFIKGRSPSIASSNSSGSLLSNQEELLALKDLPNETPLISLISKELLNDIGKNIIHTNDIYLIIINKKIDWITGIENEMAVSKISKIGGEVQQVRHHFANHLIYYNAYFPFLLLECFSQISLAWKEIKTNERLNRRVCKIVHTEIKQSYVSFQCESFIHCSDEENVPMNGDIILANFYTDSADNARLLGYVCSTVSRPYSHRRDDGHEMLKYVNENKRKNVKKIRIKFHTVFDITSIILDLPIYVFKLLSIKKTLKLNDALKKLPKYPLCESVLRPWRNNIKNITIPNYEDVNALASAVERIVNSLDPRSSQLTVIKCPAFVDSIMATVLIVEEMKKSNVQGQMLIYVREEYLNLMGMKLLKTSSNFVIISEKSKNLHKTLERRVLDVMVSHLTEDVPKIPDDLARRKVLQDADLLLDITDTCFNDHVKNMQADIRYCIIHDAHSFTEPETLLPLLYGTRHLILFGDPNQSCNVISQYASSLGYNKSLFHRAYKLS